MNIVSIVLQVLLGLAFIMGGFGKITGSKMHVEGFKKWGLPQWFRVVTGLVELIAAVGMIVGIWTNSWAAAAALVLAITMFVAILVHVRIKDSLKDTFPAILLFVLSVVVLLLRWSDLAQFPN
ncbi:DoxX family protein [Paenibacillus eucommiae]|uniref:Membrane protein YphA (DoxX/SURF4 family) n=1 Tax=Paenibacillus eucommiae TaxID=1355755 RepID=A0ABS4IR84_9BACL|nr:DoxX family protein [Paenibacillus eucommiae]MBP1990083.1 putative membrane protein YphA (DoxX/SURF4 family) [Paenibacillus eucommiae]